MKKHLLTLTLLIPALLAFPWKESGAQAQQMVFVSNQQLRSAEALQTKRQLKADLKEVLKLLQQEYHVFFTYSDELIKNKHVVFQYNSGQKLETVLEQLLPPLGLQYQKVRGKFYVIIAGK